MPTFLDITGLEDEESEINKEMLLGNIAENVSMT
jgi:hypothetical protein